GVVWSEPVGILTHKECNGRDSRRNYSPPVLLARQIVSRCFKSRGMRRQAAPSDRACQAQLIEVRRIIVRDSARQHKPFPSARRDFESLQLPNYFERPMLAAHLRTRSDMLPAQKPIHKLRCRDRSDLLAQGCNRQTMNASQQTALAPL